MEKSKYQTNNGVLLETYDEDVDNPRDNDDGIFSKFYTFLRDRISPDECNYPSFRDWMEDFLPLSRYGEVDYLFSFGQTEMAAKKLVEYSLESGYVLLPVWKYEHSEIIYRANTVNPFTCPYDSSMAGVIFCSKKDIYTNLHKRCTESTIVTVHEMMKAEVEEYSAWANGECYGYCMLDEDGEEGDWTWGFIGDIDKNGIKDVFDITECKYIGAA